MYIVSWQRYKYKYCSNLQINSRPATKQSESKGSGSRALVEVTNSKNTHHIFESLRKVNLDTPTSSGTCKVFKQTSQTWSVVYETEQRTEICS